MDDSYFEGLALPGDISAALDEIVRFSAGRTPRDLELFASVHFWARRGQEESGTYSADYVLDKLERLKPDAGFVRGDVEDAISTLEGCRHLARSS